MEILRSKVSVYEVELDLRHWDSVDTLAVPQFKSRLFGAIPSLMAHKCMAGKQGGFYREVSQGTGLAHVIEHVILELIRLADPDGPDYTGWTREVNGRGTHIIHYGAPDFLVGRLGAVLAVDLVKRLIGDKEVDLPGYLKMLEDPAQYFARGEQDSEARINLVEPASVIHEIERRRGDPWPRGPKVVLSEVQLTNIGSIISTVSRHLETISWNWRGAFLEYGGRFGEMIADKVAMINIDRFAHLLIRGEHEGFERALHRTAQMVGTYRIPAHFIIHSVWLYKNKLLEFVIEEFRHNTASLHRAVGDLDRFFQFILQTISVGFIEGQPEDRASPLDELREFRELKKTGGDILVVDDDEMVRRACRDVFRYQGYGVLLAENGAQALSVLLDKGERIALVLLDLMLPDMAGEEIISTINRLYPEMRILLMSGYSADDMGIDRICRVRRVAFIGKPFTMSALGEKVETLLAGEQASDHSTRLSQPSRPGPQYQTQNESLPPST